MSLFVLRRKYSEAIVIKFMRITRYLLTAFCVIWTVVRWHIIMHNLTHCIFGR